MADDIVKQLRRMAMRTTDSDDRNTLTDAADEIVRLCGAGRRLNAALLVTSNVWGRQHQSDDDAKYHRMVDVAVDGWGEARRG